MAGIEEKRTLARFAGFFFDWDSYTRFDANLDCHQYDFLLV